MSSIWRRVSSGCAPGRSILLMTGMISRLFSTARYALASVCASTPWDASTSRSAPSQAASDRVTSYEKSTCPGVSMRFRTVARPRRRVVQPHRVGLDRDPALALEIHRVEHLRFHLARLEGAGELEEAISQRRLAVVDVGDDRKIADEALVHGVSWESRAANAVRARLRPPRPSDYRVCHSLQRAASARARARSRRRETTLEKLPLDAADRNARRIRIEKERGIVVDQVIDDIVGDVQDFAFSTALFSTAMPTWP